MSAKSKNFLLVVFLKAQRDALAKQVKHLDDHIETAVVSYDNLTVTTNKCKEISHFAESEAYDAESMEKKTKSMSNSLQNSAV